MAVDRLAAIRRATGRYETAKQEMIDAIVAGLRAGEAPTEVTDASPYSAAQVRIIARAHGVPPARKRRRP